MKCLVCGSHISHNGDKTCGNQLCVAEHNIKRNVDHGIIPKSQTWKKLYILRRGHKCEICGLEMWLDSKIPLELHHVDGDCTNNTPENVKLLCRNCHANGFNPIHSSKNHKSTRKKVYSLV